MGGEEKRGGEEVRRWSGIKVRRGEELRRR